MAKKSTLTEAQKSISGAAKTGAAIVKPVASAALGAAAAAAAGVVLDTVSNALKSGGQRVEKATPDATEAARIAATPSIKSTTRKKAVAKKKAAAKKKLSGRKAAATKKTRPAKKQRAAKKAAKAVKKQRSKTRSGR